MFHSRAIHIALRRARLKKQLTQQELADLIGASRLSVHRWEEGQCPSRYYQTRIAEVLGLAPQELWPPKQ